MSGSLFPSPQTVERYTTGSYVNGLWSGETTTTVTVQGSVQPITGRDVDVQEGGRKDVGQVWLITDAALSVSVEGSAARGDVLIWQGRRYEIVRREDWSSQVLNHVRYRCEYRGLE